MPARGSHRSVRARIRAYGSSDHALARRKMIPVAHTPAHELPCGDRAASSAIRRRFVDTLSGFPGIRRSSFRRSRDPTPRFPRRGPPVCGGVPALRGGRLRLLPSVLSGRCDFPPSVPPRFVSFAWRCRRCCVRRLRSRRPCERAAGGPGLVGFGQPVPSCVATETTGSPKFLAEPRLHLRRALRPRQDRGHLTRRDAPARPPWRERRGLPHCGFRGSIPRLWCSLSTLSPRRSPARDARLASGCWSGAAGRARPAGFLREVSE